METTWRDRLRYAIDEFFARGTIALILGLFAVSGLFYLYKIRVYNDYFFALRRYVPIVLPFLLGLAALALVRMAAGGRWRRAAAALLAVFLFTAAMFDFQGATTPASARPASSSRSLCQRVTPPLVMSTTCASSAAAGPSGRTTSTRPSLLDENCGHHPGPSRQHASSRKSAARPCR